MIVSVLLWGHVTRHRRVKLSDFRKRLVVAYDAFLGGLQVVGIGKLDLQRCAFGFLC